MATYVFELVECTDANLEAVEAAIATIAGVTLRITKSARGEFVLFVECGCSEDEILDLLDNVLARLEVHAQKQPLQTNPQVGKPKF